MPSRSPSVPATSLGLWGSIVLFAVLSGTLCVAKPAALTHTSIHLALIEYFIALWLMISMSQADWSVETRTGQRARQLWTWSCITFLVHVACAFHFTHHWSHTHALEQTRRESGFGEGLYVNYVFMAAWIADATWWQISPWTYARRPRWIDATLHSFMLFIAFNATVIFEAGAVRSISLIATGLLAHRWLTGSSPDQPAPPEA